MTSKKLKQSGELTIDKDIDTNDTKISKSIKKSGELKSSKKSRKSGESKPPKTTSKKSLEVENFDELDRLKTHEPIETHKTPTEILNETDNIFIFDKITKPKQKLKSTKSTKSKKKKTKKPKIDETKQTSIYNWDEPDQEQINPDLTKLESDFLSTEDEPNYNSPDENYNYTSPEEISGIFPNWESSDSVGNYDVSNPVENESELDHSDVDYNLITDSPEPIDVILSQPKKKFKFSNLFKKNKSGKKSKKIKSNKKIHKSIPAEDELVTPTESVEYQLSDLDLSFTNLDDDVQNDIASKIANELKHKVFELPELIGEVSEFSEVEMSKDSGEILDINKSGEDELPEYSGENESNKHSVESEMSQNITEDLTDISLSEEFSLDLDETDKSHTTESESNLFFAGDDSYPTASDGWDMTPPVVDDTNLGLAENAFSNDELKSQSPDEKPVELPQEIKPIEKSGAVGNSNIQNKSRPVYIDIGLIVSQIEKNRPISEALKNVKSENIRDVIKLIKPKLKPAFQSKLDNYLATSPELDMPLVEFRDRLAYYSEHFSNILPATVEGIIEMIETIYQIDYNEISLWIQKLDRAQISYSTAMDFWLQVTTVYPTMLFGMTQIPLTIFHRGNSQIWQELTKVKMLTHDIESGEDGQFMTVWNACPVDVKFVDKHSLEVDTTVDNLMRYKMKILSKSNEPFLLFDREISTRIFNVDFKVSNIIKYLFISDDPLNDISSKINGLAKFNNDWLVVGLRAFGESVDSNVVYNGNNLTSDCYHVSEFLEIPEELDEFFHVEVVR